MLDRSSLRALSADVEAALVAVGKKHKVELKIGSARFASNFATFKLEVRTLTETGEAVSKEAETFKALAKFYGLEASDLGVKFFWSRNVFELVGLNPKARRFPFVGRRVLDGKVFKLPAEIVETVKNGRATKANAS